MFSYTFSLILALIFFFVAFSLITNTFFTNTLYDAFFPDESKELLFSGFLTVPSNFIFILLMALLILNIIWAYLTYKNYKYQLTDDALKIEKGVIIKKYITLPYARIQNIDIYRGLLARLLKLSDLQIHTAGYSGSAPGSFSEGRLPGLDINTAEQLREELTKKLKGSTAVSNPTPASAI